MHRFFGFLNDLGASVTFAELPAPKIVANGVTGLFEFVAAQEARVTEAIHAAVDQARLENDHLGVFPAMVGREQHEEDTLCRAVLDRIALICGGRNALYFIDQEIGRLAAKE